MSAYDAIVNFFTGRGWSTEQSKGIAGNLFGESRYDIAAIGDGGKAYGLAQWHPDRQSIFERVFGKSIKGSTFEEQLAFVDWELRNNEKRAGSILRQQTTVEGSTEAFMRYYERPANMSSLGNRVSAAMGEGAAGTSGIAKSVRDLEKKILGWLGVEDPDWWTDPNADPSGLDPTGGFLTSFFTGEMAARFAAVIIGIILVGLAIAAFTLLSDNKSEVLKAVTSGVK